MIIYWLALSIAVARYLVSPMRPWSRIESWLIGIIMCVTIGLRDKVGSDWGTYIFFLNRAKGQTLQQAILTGDSGYNVLNWYFASHQWGIYGVNFIVAIIFSYGVVLFCKAQPRPYLALCIAIPYLITVVGMGYTRQAGAIGLIMAGLLDLEKGRLRRFLSYIAIATLFHSTSLVFLIYMLPVIEGKRSARWLTVVMVVASSIGLALTVLSEKIEGLIGLYDAMNLRSEGAAIRVAMSLLPATIITSYPNRLGLEPKALKLWRWMGFTAIACAIGLIALPQMNTAIDRIALYVIPLQIVVGCRLPESRIFGLNTKEISALILVYVVLIQFTWLFFASNSRLWIPYSNILLGG